MNFKTSAECGVKTKVDFDLFHCNGICSQYGFLTNPSHVTHYLIFTVTVTSSLLWSKPYSDYQFFLHNKISELRKQGLGYRRISNILNEEGILTVRGKVFTNSHVHSILKKKNIREERLNRKSRKEVSRFVLEGVGLFD